MTGSHKARSCVLTLYTSKLPLRSALPMCVYAAVYMCTRVTAVVGRGHPRLSSSGTTTFINCFETGSFIDLELAKYTLGWLASVPRAARFYPSPTPQCWDYKYAIIRSYVALQREFWG